MVKLNKAETKILNSIADVKARKAAELKLISEKTRKLEERQAKSKEYFDRIKTARQRPIEFAVTDAGYLCINNTGTKRNAVLSPEKARALVKNFGELKALVETLPEVARPIGQGSKE